ncbi:MAG TPA: PIG-L deacetylase family protein [Anaerolineales bacterium]|jgi:LmbE family N-acetylglucosaminyl deacetylase|nr:PIG-L deacetylase family protein [Anaerolineales bacterium]
MSNNFPEPERVLVVVAHPDDPEFGAAGTVALWASRGAQVTYVIVTDGSKGSAEKEMTREKLVALREAEQRKAAEAVGVSEVVFLRLTDGEIENNDTLRELLVRQIRIYKPDVLVTHDPTSRIVGGSYLNHRDHRTVGDAALDATFPLARDRLNYPEHEQEGLDPHKVLDVFLIFSDQPNYWVDISSTIELKINALQAHKSQIADLDELPDRIRERGRAVAEKVSFEYGETFRRVQLNR